MLNLLIHNADVAFIVVLLGIAIAAFLTSRLGELPAKGWVFVAAGAASVVGWQVLRNQRKTVIKKEIDRLETRIKEREPKIEVAHEDYVEAKADFTQEQAALQEAKINYQREVALIGAKTKERREEILRMTPDQVREAFANEM